MSVFYARIQVRHRGHRRVTPDMSKDCPDILAVIKKYGTNPSSFSSNDEEIKFYNTWADFWRYVIGVSSKNQDQKDIHKVGTVSRQTNSRRST